MQVSTKWTNTYHSWICRETQHSPTETAFQFIPCLDLLFIFSSITSISPSFAPAIARRPTELVIEAITSTPSPASPTWGTAVASPGATVESPAATPVVSKNTTNVRTARWHRAVEKKTHFKTWDPSRLWPRRFCWAVEKAYVLYWCTYHIFS